jgi:sulfotransferase
MENNFRKNPDKQDPVLDWSKMQGTSVPKRIDIWAQNPPVGMALERLSEIFRMGIDKKMLFVKFEDLCLYPDTEMQRIYQYLDLPYFEHDFDNIEQITKEDDVVYGVFGDHNIRKKLEPVQSKAKTLLGKDVCDWVYNNYRWFFDQFRYSK